MSSWTSADNSASVRSTSERCLRFGTGHRVVDAMLSYRCNGNKPPEITITKEVGALARTAQAERLSMDAALRRALLAQSELGVALCGADGVLTAANPALESMLGVPYVRSGPTAWSRCFHLCDEDGGPLPPGGDPLARAVRGERVIDEVVSARPPDGTVRFLRCNASRLHHADGTVAGAVVFVADATAEISQRRGLDVLREQLVETVNHELRTPVAIIKGHVELLQVDHAACSATAHWSLDAIARGLERLEEVLNSIRDLADQTARRH